MLRPVLGLGLVLAAAVAALPAPGADPSTPPPATDAQSPAPAAPVPIPLIEIPRAAERASIELRRMWTEAQPTPALAAIEDELPAVVERLETFLAQTEVRHLDRVHGSRLAQLRQPWQLQHDSLERWRDKVGERLEALAKLRSELDAMRQTWTATRDAAALELPELAGANVEQVLERIETLQGELRSRLEAVLSIDGRLAATEAEVVEVLGRFDAATIGARRQLLARDTHSAWSMMPLAAGESWGGRARRLWSDVRTDVVDFGQAYGGRLVFHALLTVALLVVTSTLRRREDAAGVEPGPSIIVAHPYATSVLLSLLATLWIYPVVPGVVFTIARLIGFIVAMRLLPVFLPAPVVPLGYVLAVSWIAFTLGDLLLEPSGPARIFVLLLSVVAVVALARFLDRAGRADSPPPPRLVLAARIAAVLALLSSLATLLGYIPIAKLLLSIVLGGAYLAIGLWLGNRGLLEVLSLATRTPPLSALRALQANRHQLLRRLEVLLDVGAVVWWCQTILERAQVWQPVRRALGALLSRPWTLGAIELTLGHVLGFLLTLTLAVLLARVVQALLERDVLARLDLPRGVPAAVSTLVRYLLIALGLLAALGAAGIQLGQLAILAGALGVGIGFGLQNVVSNFVAGLILVFERPIRVGDTVQVGTLVGDVRRIGVRASTLRTPDGSEVIVPNGNLVATDVVNWTLTDLHRRVEIPVGVRYGSDIRRVMGILTEVAAGHEKVRREPPPLALFQGFGASSLDFILRFWTGGEGGEWVQVRSDVAVGISDALAEAGITIPFPQLDLHVQTGSPGSAGERAGDA